MQPRRCLAPLFLLATSTAFAQAPTGAIAGTVYDASGSVVPNAAIKVKSDATAFERSLTSNQTGQYSAPSLAAGTYEIHVSAAGFHNLDTKAVVATGNTTTVNLHLQVGEQKDTVTVETTEQMVEVEGDTLDQVVTRKQIEQLPLNGRSFLQLAFLAPGVIISSNYQGDYNRAMDVSVLGNDPDRTRISVDGARINDAVDGGTQQNFSQEIVQEFQISSVNFDLSTGVCAGGAINIVTRTGSNQLHGSGFFFFRDHHMAAYPGLNRDPLASDPFFARRQIGGWIGGPVVKDRLFFFAAYEHNNQDGVFTSVPSDPAFASLARVTPSPRRDNLVNARLDYRISGGNTAFIRYSHDGNNAFAPREINSLPSAWESNENWADSGVFSLVSTIRPTLVNEFRYSNTFWSNRNNPPSASQCRDCIGLGGPHVIVEGAGVAFGNQTNSPQSRLVRRNIFDDNMTWQHGAHRFKFGGEIEFLKGTGTYVLDAPAAITLFSPQEVRQLAPPLTALLPTSFQTAADVFALPLKNFAFGVGDINQPPSFQRNQADHDRLFHVYWQDTWKVAPRVAVNYGLAWSYESNALNHDLTKPQLLAPIFGANGLGHEEHAKLRFTPAAGFAWTLPDTRTVIRAGGGIFYDTINIEARLVERAYLGPLGTGFLPLPGSIVPNPIPGIPGLPVGTPLDLRTPSAFSGTLLNLLLPVIRSTAISTLHVNPNNTDLTIRNIDVFKTGTDLFVSDFVPSSAQHLSVGVERQVRSDFAVTADFVYRHYLHETLRGVDLNHFNAVAGPVLPRCSAATAQVPGVPCSNGPIQATISGGRSTYKGLLLRADKRFSHRYQLQASYALASDQNVYGIRHLDTPIENLNNWMQDVGPNSPRHILTISGAVDVPGGVQVSFLSSFQSKLPFQPIITGADFYGTGVDMFLLPGSGTNRFNFGLDKGDLVSLVNQYNQTYAGKKGPNPAQIFPAVTLPSNFSTGHVFNSQDFRVTKLFKFAERWQWQLFGEVFNLLNTANLNGYQDNLLAPGFGQPTSRFSSIFGTGGPRSFQLGTRLSF
ncbi:MAG TPA: TonB-dependent receptor [Candidatus Solibacter sp.]|nr:TonB-dependent receptor [Candidatus Solibacter sp.]